MIFQMDTLEDQIATGVTRTSRMCVHNRRDSLMLMTHYHKQQRSYLRQLLQASIGNVHVYNSGMRHASFLLRPHRSPPTSRG